VPLKAIFFTLFLAVLQTSANEKKRNFIETIEAHVMLGVDPRRGDQVHSAFKITELFNYPATFSTFLLNIQS
jgi:hypothetical protein